MRLLTNNQGALSQKLILCNIFMFLIIVEFYIRHWRAHRWNLVCRHNNLTYCSYFSIQCDTSNQVINSIVLIMLITMMVMIMDGEKTWINSCRQKTKSVFFFFCEKSGLFSSCWTLTRLKCDKTDSENHNHDWWWMLVKIPEQSCARKKGKCRFLPSKL